MALWPCLLGERSWSSFLFSPFMRLGTDSAWETASSHPCLTPVLLAGKGSPREPEGDPGKLAKPLWRLPKAGLGPLFSPSTFWFVGAELKGDDASLLSTGFEKVNSEPAVEPLAA